MFSTAAIRDTVHLATDTGQSSMALFGVVILGVLVLVTLCVYLFPAFAAIAAGAAVGHGRRVQAPAP
jgi:hypothetical protein